MSLLASPPPRAPAFGRGAPDDESRTAAARILLVEDDAELAHAVQELLRRRGHRVECVPRTTLALRSMAEHAVDLVLFDLGVTGDGLEVLKAARRRNAAHPPVLVFSTREVDALRVLAMKAGADDYLVKPFTMVDLERRVTSLLRRGAAEDKRGVLLGDVAFDPLARTLRVGHARQSLSRREASLIDALSKEFGNVVTKGQLMAAVFGDEMDISQNTLEVFIHRVRKKLVGSRLTLRTVHGKGYVLEFLEPGPGS